MSKWEEETTLRFVNMYKEYESLWNFDDNEYRNRQIRDNALQQIVGRMAIDGFTLQEAKAKINSLKSTYSQEVVKINKARAAGHVYTPRMKWFVIMDSFYQERKKRKAHNSSNTIKDEVLSAPEDNITIDEEGWIPIQPKLENSPTKSIVEKKREKRVRNRSKLTRDEDFVVSEDAFLPLEENDITIDDDDWIPKKSKRKSTMKLVFEEKNKKIALNNSKFTGDKDTKKEIKIEEITWIPKQPKLEKSPTISLDWSSPDKSVELVESTDSTDSDSIISIENTQTNSENTMLDSKQLDIFGRSVSAQLKMLPIEQAIPACDEIQRVLTKYRLKNLQQKKNFNLKFN